MGRLPASPEVQVFIVPKTGSTEAECEDAAYFWSSPDVTAPMYFAAVADGASESLLAGAWARQLVVDAVESMGFAERWWEHVELFVQDLMSRAGGRWNTYVDAYQTDRAARGRPIEWYEQPGLDKGAFATVLGVQLTSVDTELEWRAFALGDSCLFGLRDGALLGSFPIEDPAGFDITPQLLGSRNRDSTLVAERLSIAHGELRAGDELLLATDALAAWLLATDGSRSVRALCAVADLGPEDFADWVVDQRARKRMRNDDVALIRLRVKAGD